MRPLFFYDLGSPYAWLTAERIDALFGAARPEWVPVLLGGIFKATGRGSWGETDAREGGIAEIERRAADRGLPGLTWPSPWPNNGLYAMRVAAALDSREFALAAFRMHFTEGLALSETGERRRWLPVARVASRRSTRTGCAPTPTARWRWASTACPPSWSGGEVFWGDDRLEEAASASGPEQQLE